MDAKNVYQAIDVEIFPEKEIIAFIEAEFSTLRNQIISNIQGAGKTASGDTERSIHTEKEGTNSISLLGREYFEELETGTPPRSQPANFNQIILQWAEDKGIPIKQQNELVNFADMVANKIKVVGSKQYRDGKRINIYANEVQDSWMKIDDFIDTKIKWFLETITL